VAYKKFVLLTVIFLGFLSYPIGLIWVGVKSYRFGGIIW